MDISKEHLIKLLNTGTNQYIIPFFQRPYVWKKEDCENLLEDILATYEEGKIKPQKEHFIGTVITKINSSSTQMAAKYNLVDGQQRMTTFCLVIKALANSVDSTVEGANFLIKNINSSLFYEDAYGKVHYRIIHNRLDKKSFDLVMQSDCDTDIDITSNGSKIIDTYLFFKEKFKDFTNEEILALNVTILHKFPAINMVLDHNDDEQEIFDTINSLGVKLTTSELLKNHIFNDDETKEHYKEYWEDIFEVDEETVKFWNTKKTAGRVYRENIDVLLYCYLLIEKEKDVSLEHLFKDYKAWLKDKKFEDKKEFLQALKTYAEIYFSLPSGTELESLRFSDNEKRFFHIIENLNITTVYPLILFLYKNIEDTYEREKCLILLESYLVRRAVCKLTTKNYNNLFISLIKQLKEVETPKLIDSLSEILLSYSDDTSRFPSDEEFKTGFANSVFSNQYSKEFLFIITLYHVNTVLHDITSLSSESFSVEHIMPKKWQSNWQANLTPEEKNYRNQKLLTLGNLTIITRNLNSKLRNSAWAVKKEILTEYSSLPLTTKYVNSPDWNEQTISDRANDLYATALIIWKK
ncbi:DUF262 domain-containing protein [Flavobacterium alkalisoli]|uniref:DUF262 domain-containing protein n=1 Tax=Flavobacterium alkalisoli TaxID=2602769 RepID=A0A5B9FTM5_9FLAO|nr:DUF262 domain-containing protein [Flavobacterium alkalisoli]QEE50703.1 DUF262 domain-containing protein [Flavobacterium alkalisoli]